MGKFFLILGILIAGVAGAAFIAWTNKSAVAAHFLSRELNGVPVAIRSLQITKEQSNVAQLRIGNPPRSRTPVAFAAEQMKVQTTIQQVMGDPMTIDEIVVKDIFVGVEFYDSKQQDSNWNYILATDEKKKKKEEKDYLIRKLTLYNLTVEVTQSNGQVKRYPTIPKMEFYNISSATGFPIDEIEKAIFNLVLKDLFKKLNLDQILKDQLQKVPNKYLPKLFK